MGRRAGFTAESRFFWIRIQIFWKHLLPGLADSHVRETVSFPDLLSPQSGGRRRCFKSIRAGRNIRDLNGSVPVHPSVQNYWGFFLPGDQRLSGSVHLPEWLVKFHTGYELDENDFHDVKALCERFCIALPDEYSRFTRSGSTSCG